MSTCTVHARSWISQARGAQLEKRGISTQDVGDRLKMEGAVAWDGLKSLLQLYGTVISGKPVLHPCAMLLTPLPKRWAQHQKRVARDLILGLPWVPIVGAVPGGSLVFMAAAVGLPKALPSTFAAARSALTSPAASGPGEAQAHHSEESHWLMKQAPRDVDAPAAIDVATAASLASALSPSPSSSSSLVLGSSPTRCHAHVRHWAAFLLEDDQLLRPELDTMGEEELRQAAHMRLVVPSGPGREPVVAALRRWLDVLDASATSSDGDVRSTPGGTALDGVQARHALLRRHQVLARKQSSP